MLLAALEISEILQMYRNSDRLKLFSYQNLQKYIIFSLKVRIEWFPSKKLHNRRNLLSPNHFTLKLLFNCINSPFTLIVS